MKTLEITTKIGCRNNCPYCPQDTLIKSYCGNLFLTLNQFKAILKNVPKDITLDFTGFCEAFLNPHASMMMRYAIITRYKVMLITTTTGFTKVDADILRGLRFDHVLIHEFPGIIKDKDYFKRVELLRSSIITERFEQFDLPEKNQFSRASNLWDIPYKKGTFECGWSKREFYRNVVLPNGDTYLCCMDYSLKQKIGNLFKTNYNDLDRDSIIQKTFLEDSDLICRKCEIARYD